MIEIVFTFIGLLVLQGWLVLYKLDTIRDHQKELEAYLKTGQAFLRRQEFRAYLKAHILSGCMLSARRDSLSARVHEISHSRQWRPGAD